MKTKLGYVKQLAYLQAQETWCDWAVSQSLQTQERLSFKLCEFQEEMDKVAVYQHKLNRVQEILHNLTKPSITNLRSVVWQKW